jgi:hypothetical protein
MATKRFKVRVFRKAKDPRDPGKEEPSLAFNIEAKHPDHAATLVRAKLEAQGCDVVSLSHAPDQGIVATIALGARTGPATTLVAHLATVKDDRPTSKHRVIGGGGR